MNTFPQTDVNSLDPKNREQLIRMATELLKGNNPGILSTIDQSGFPQSRWMATMSFDDFPDLYTLTSARSRKVAQIQEHPSTELMIKRVASERWTFWPKPWTKRGPIAILAGNPRAPNLQNRVAGAKEALAKYPNMKLNERQGVFYHVEIPEKGSGVSPKHTRCQS